MEKAYLNLTNQYLLEQINRQYGVLGERIRLYRVSGGCVYFIYSSEAKRVFKLFRPMHKENAIQSTRIITHLANCDYPVVKIIPTVSGDRYISFDTHEGQCIGILFEFARGKSIGFLHRWRDNKQPIIHPKAKAFGRQVGLMHRLMEKYDGPIIYKGRERYIDDFIMLLRRDGHDETKIRDLEDYGNELWSSLEALPTGFCHGDMHTGNTAYFGGQFTWMDFDRASYSYPVIDVGWLADGTDFNVFDAKALDRSLELFEKLYEGYSQERSLTNGEISAVFGCTAIIHYDLFSSIVIMNNGILNKAEVDEQYDWLMRWREHCIKRRI